MNHWGKQRSKENFDRLKKYFENENRFMPFFKKDEKLKLLKIRRASPLFSDVAELHATRMIDAASTIFSGVNQDTVRWVTLLDSVAKLEAQDIKDRIRLIKKTLMGVFKKVGLRKVYGVFEFEIVSFDLINSYIRQGVCLEGKETKKINVLNSMFKNYHEFGEIRVPTVREGACVLIHVHAIIDFGAQPQGTIDDFSSRIRSFKEWSVNNAQLHIERLYAGNSFSSNIENLCRYMSKGGNEDLRYKLAFERDKKDVPIPIEEIELSTFRHPFDTTGMSQYQIRKLRDLMGDEIAFDNVWHLKNSEIVFLNSLYADTMKMFSARGLGYVISVHS